MSRLEFAYILKRLGEPLTDEEVDEILDHFDRDGSGEIDFDGTLNWQTHKKWTPDWSLENPYVRS